MTTNSAALRQLETYSGQEWDQTPTPKLQKCITFDAQTFWIEEMLHHGKHAPVPTILKLQIWKLILCIKLLIFCYLCFIVNKILAHVILKSFSYFP